MYMYIYFDLKIVLAFQKTFNQLPIKTFSSFNAMCYMYFKNQTINKLISEVLYAFIFINIQKLALQTSPELEIPLHVV